MERQLSLFYYPEKLFTSVLPRLTLLPYFLQGLHNAFIISQLTLSFFLKRNYHKILIETSMVVLTFAAIESAVSGFKGEQRP